MAGSSTPGGRRASADRPDNPWPRDFGRDGVSGLVSVDRAMRARDVSRPRPDDDLMAATVIDSLLARIDGRRRPGR